ncbi:hypothetical protein PLANPX_4109 [Lacipirellula parvula]|uniref:Uncharacterized protein n=1 Tax=Lacipirellula parvula TaxID=2650471 RepID=A0A5K7XEL1_9BACT|nr:hypothetical protein PLANPX_4109 [Lacipirellula parvula]
MSDPKSSQRMCDWQSNSCADSAVHEFTGYKRCRKPNLHGLSWLSSDHQSAVALVL